MNLLYSKCILLNSRPQNSTFCAFPARAVILPGTLSRGEARKKQKSWHLAARTWLFHPMLINHGVAVKGLEDGTEFEIR